MIPALAQVQLPRGTGQVALAVNGIEDLEQVEVHLRQAHSGSSCRLRTWKDSFYGRAG